jgi:hypothetical protein
MPEANKVKANYSRDEKLLSEGGSFVHRPTIFPNMAINGH